MTTIAVSSSTRTRQPAAGSRQEREILSRLRKAHVQLAGITSMYEGGRSCVDVLDQLSAVTAAVDGAAVCILTDHINDCVRAAIQSGGTDEQVANMETAVRRYVRSREDA